MTDNALEPRLDAGAARRLRENLLDDLEGAVFDEAHFDEMLKAPRTFPATGGRPVARADLLALRGTCLEAVGQLPSDSSEFGAKFDLRIGAVLYRYSVGRLSEFGDPGVWDFLTLVLLPDVIAPRLAASRSRSAQKERLTGGHRRHVLQRLWRRWTVFGEEVVTSRILMDDDYVALLERQVTSEHPAISRAVAERVREVKNSGQDQRAYTRQFMRRFLALTGLVGIASHDASQAEILVAHVHAETLEALGWARGGEQASDVSSPADALWKDADERHASPEATAPVARKRKPFSFGGLLRSR